MGIRNWQLHKLHKRFPSFEDLSQASPELLQNVAQIGREKAKKLYDAIQQRSPDL